MGKHEIELCSQCGESTEELYEGVCWHCCDENQHDLYEHNTHYDWWESLGDSERDSIIRDTSKE
jgi:predicted amidophosphoribosyltransferase